MKRLSMMLLIALLLSVSTVLAQDFETVDQGSIAVGDTVDGELDAGVRDQYTLEVEEDSTLNFYLDGENDMDTYLRIYLEGDDEPIAENDDRGDGTLFSAVEGLEVSEGDVLIVEVGTFADGGEGEYTLRVTTPATIEEAGEISLDESVEATLSENTRQQYTIDIDDTTALNITAESDDIDTYVRLYIEGNDVPSAQSADGFNSLVVPADTSLIVEVGAVGDASEGDFTLTIEEADVDLGETADSVELDEDTTLDDICDDAEDIDEPERLQFLAPEDVLEEDVDYGAVFCTEEGNFRVDLFEDEAPIATNSFVYLASQHFFDHVTFHRVIPDFVVQGGDPQGTGVGGPGYEFENETDNDLTFGGIGVLGMANAGPDTNGSQFFITLAPVAFLDGGYTIFGQVQEGMASVFDIEERDPATADDEGTLIYTVIIVTLPE